MVVLEWALGGNTPVLVLLQLYLCESCLFVLAMVYKRILDLGIVLESLAAMLLCLLYVSLEWRICMSLYIRNVKYFSHLNATVRIVRASR